MQTDLLTLSVVLRVGESVRVGDAVVTLEDKSGKNAKISVRAPESVPVERMPTSTMADVAKNGIGPRPVPA